MNEVEHCKMQNVLRELRTVTDFPKSQDECRLVERCEPHPTPRPGAGRIAARVWFSMESDSEDIPDPYSDSATISGHLQRAIERYARMFGLAARFRFVSKDDFIKHQKSMGVGPALRRVTRKLLYPGCNVFFQLMFSLNVRAMLTKRQSERRELSALIGDFLVYTSRLPRL
jgi:hypothetical protein